MEPVDASVTRLMDASLNRASEGARVVEDFARFVLGDGHLSRLAKELRHGVAAAGAALPMTERLAARDTPGDVGAGLSTDSESRRAGAWHVTLASLARLQEALRSLEEYGKTIDPAVGAAFEKLRYETYTIAKGLGATHVGRQRLRGTRLYVLVDCGESLEAFSERISSLCAAGVGALQLRDKAADDRTLAERARTLVRLCRDGGVTSIINDRADIAVIAGADGVHVGQEELPVADARRILGAGKLVGVSTRSIEQAREAVLAGADYLGAGPTFPSRTKRFERFPGLAFLSQIAEEIRLPTFAIGGISVENLPEVLAAGARRVAVGSSVNDSPDPAAAANELTRMLEGTVGNLDPPG